MAKYGRKRHSLVLFFAAVAFYGVLLFSWKRYREWLALVRLDTVARSYYHYDFIELRLRAWDNDLVRRFQNGPPPRVAVLKDGRRVATIAGLEVVDLKWDENRGAFIGRWPCPWNAPAGEYVPTLLGHQELNPRLRVRPFYIQYRKPPPLPRRFVVLTMESLKPLATMRVRTPDGSVKDWRGLLDWVQFVGADAFWLLGSRTPGDHKGEVWVSYNFSSLPLVARECHKRRIQFGLYAMDYLTLSKVRLPRYQYAMEVQEGRPVATRAISLLDPNRPGDVADLLKRFGGIPGVDYLGIDYIRNALGGYEMAEEFFAEMPGVHPPPEWGRLTHEERMVWFARKKIMRRDEAFVDAWQWWRARRAALVVRRIKDEIGDEKPLWAFTLTWDKGWHHGQDSVMFNDAGVDADALMLYEADDPQFAQMMRDWHAYVRSSDTQLLVGDVVDWPLHQHSPLGPQAFVNRMTRAMEYIYQDGPAKGIFIHDLDRALWGRLGPYSTMDWMTAARTAVRHFREIKDAAPAAPADRRFRGEKSAKLTRRAPSRDLTAGSAPLASPQAPR